MTERPPTPTDALETELRAELSKRVYALTQRLVRMPSVTDSAGEAETANFLRDYISEQAGLPDSLLIESVPAGKANGATSVLALLPAGAATAQTLVLMGHFDTVGLEPYELLQQSGLDSAALKQHYLGSADQLLAAHAASPDWAFGRGWLDMKGGLALIVELFLHLARSGCLRANIMLLLACDEEAESRGIRSLLQRVAELVAERGLKLTQVVNTDFCAPHGEGDESRPLYSGTVGKALIGVSVFGRSTHAGQPFAGLNASALAAHIAAGTEHSRKLLAGAGGEWLPPPAVLHLAARRERYDVMTADCAELYFNLFHLGRDTRYGWRDLQHEIRRLVHGFDREMRMRYNRIARRSNKQPPRFRGRARVLDFAALRQAVAHRIGEAFEQSYSDLVTQVQQDHRDAREQAFAVVRGLHAQLRSEEPLVVVSLLQPYYPGQIRRKEGEGQRRLEKFARTHGLSLKRVYPFISDMSYFSFSSGSMAELEAQSPFWFSSEEIELFSSLSAPVLNLGPWGYGAHSASERVNLPYLCDELPTILLALLGELSASGSDHE